MTAPDPALTTRAEAAYPGVAHEIQIARAAFIAGALYEREAVGALSDENRVANAMETLVSDFEQFTPTTTSNQYFIEYDGREFEVTVRRMTLEEAQKR